MGPWFIRDPGHPFRPGCSYETLTIFIKRGRVTPATVLRGPTTRQFWMFARRVPTVANMLGICHSCQAAVKPEDAECPYCHADFRPETDRQHLGLADVRLLPGQATPEMIAASTFGTMKPASPVVSRPETPPPVIRHAPPRPSQGMLVAVVILAFMCTGLLAALTYMILAPSFSRPTPDQSQNEPTRRFIPDVPPTRNDSTPATAPHAPPDPSDEETPEEPEDPDPTAETPGDDPDDEPSNADPPHGSIQPPRYASFIADMDAAVVRHGLDLLRSMPENEMDAVARSEYERIGELRLDLLRIRRHF